MATREVEIYAWNETILSIYAIGWSLFVTFFHSEGSILSARLIIGAVIAGTGLSLLLVQQMVGLRTFLDFTIPRYVLKLSPRSWAPFIIKLWPASAAIRLWDHFWFTVWWLLMGIAVLLRLNDVSDVRFLAYFVIALLHFDRLLRLIQWMRQ